MADALRAGKPPGRAKVNPEEEMATARLREHPSAAKISCGFRAHWYAVADSHGAD